MTSEAIKKLRTITYDAKGKPVSVLLNLKNKMMREAYEKAMEEIEDRMDTEEAMKRMNDGSEMIPWEEAKKRIYSEYEMKE